MPSAQQIHSNGIYHGLPVFSPEITQQTVIVAGANGISGQHLLKVLLEGGKRWKKIYCLSRRPPHFEGATPDQVEHVKMDFTNEPPELVRTLQDRSVTADYIFFCAYIQPPGLWSDSKELTRINSLILDNLLQALRRSSIIPKRFLLQTGAKNYGMHLGPAKMPQEETDPRVEIEGHPNFYYAQEDLLFKFCEETGCSWNICMPGPVFGAVKDSFMCGALPIGIYAAVSKRLGEPLVYPGDTDVWQRPMSVSSAKMNSYMEEWAVLEAPPNEKFNTQDSGSFTWESAWPKIAAWFGIDWEGPSHRGEDCYKKTEMPYIPRGYGPKASVRMTFSLGDWAKRGDVQEAWKSLAQEYGLSQTDMPDPETVFEFADFTICCPATLDLSMGKSRKLGWHGYVDSAESLHEVFHEFVTLKMLPSTFE